MGIASSQTLPLSKEEIRRFGVGNGNLGNLSPNPTGLRQTISARGSLCCVVTLVCLGVSGLAPGASAIVGAVECTMTLTAAPIPGITELGFEVTDSITVLGGSAVVSPGGGSRTKR